MVINSEVSLRAVCTKDAVGLMRGLRMQRKRPETVWEATASDHDLIVFENFDIVVGKNSNAFIIAKLRKGNKSASLEVVKNKS
jgi:hypothetical protein